jgi:hypothetical protein
MESSSHGDHDTSDKSLSADFFREAGRGSWSPRIYWSPKPPKRLNDRQNALRQDNSTRDQFLAFSNVPVSVASNLGDDSCRVSTFARQSYNVTIQNVDLQNHAIMGPHHEHFKTVSMRKLLQRLYLPQSSLLVVHLKGVQKETPRSNHVEHPHEIGR